MIFGPKLSGVLPQLSRPNLHPLIRPPRRQYNRISNLDRQNNSCVVATLQQCSSDPPILKRKWIPTIRNKQHVPVSSIEDGEDPRKMASNGCAEPQAAPTLSWIYEEAGISCGDLQNESEGK